MHDTLNRHHRTITGRRPRAAAWLATTLCVTPLVAWAWQERADDDAARRRLIRKTAGQDDGDIMTAIIDGMALAEQRLTLDLDPSPETLATQEDILRDIDRAIEEARQNLQSRGRKPQPADSQPPGEADDARDTTTQQPGQDDAGEGGQRDDRRPAAGDGGALFEARRQWGNLPPRQRQEIMQGINEEFDEEFREHINRYYEALSREANDD